MTPEQHQSIVTDIHARHAKEVGVLKEQVSFWQKMQMEQVVRTNEEIHIAQALEEQLTTLQSKSAALVDALNRVSMLLCEANPNCCQEYLFGVITGAHTVSEETLSAFKGEK